VLVGAGIRLDPTAITRIERGTRDVKLSEATAIASVVGIDLGKSLTEIAFSPDQKFRMGVAAVAASALQARRMLVEALDEIDRMILNDIDHETQKRLSKEAGFSGIGQLYGSLIRQERDREPARAMQSEYVNDVERRAKQAVITAVIDEVLVEGLF
jgi:hypothetical protein